MPKAVIVGASGQDGVLLTRLLEKKQYEIIKIEKNGYLNILDAVAVSNFIRSEQPKEIYYLAAYHHSSQDDKPDNLELFRNSFNINFFGLLYFLEAISKYSMQTRLFYAASSHIFGDTTDVPQTEITPISPRNVYGISKATALFTCKYYRENFGIFASVGILYNHESSLRKESFFSKKVCKAAIKIKKGEQKILELGNLDQEVDFGYAEDYVVAMWKILSTSNPDDFIISTGEKHSLRDFVKLAFEEINLDYRDFISLQIKENSNLILLGSNNKIKQKVGWEPTIRFDEMVKLLVHNEMNILSLEKED